MESLDSAVLLQHFLTGLCPEISRQLLLCNRPETFTNALKDAEEIEYALTFDDSGEGINAIQHKKKQSECQDGPALSQTLEALMKRLESLETTLQMNTKTQGPACSKHGAADQLSLSKILELVSWDRATIVVKRAISIEV